MHSPARRTLLFALAGTPLISACASNPSIRIASPAQASLAALETMPGDRLGVFALNTADGTQLSYRSNERFPLCSTFKVLVTAAILERSMHDDALLQRRVRYTPGELVAYSPITERHFADGMTVAELCAAAIQYSDNTAGNLLMKMIGGPVAVTSFARSIGDSVSRLDRWETELNTAIPGDPRDTSTPFAMAQNLRRFVLGDELGSLKREQLQSWLCGNTTGATRIRAGVPADWQVGDKTGGGDYGTNNDIAVLWPPGRSPIVMALYFTQREKNAKPRNEVLASAARIIVKAFSYAA